LGENHGGGLMKWGGAKKGLLVKPKKGERTLFQRLELQVN